MFGKHNNFNNGNPFGNFPNGSTLNTYNQQLNQMQPHQTLSPIEHMNMQGASMVAHISAIDQGYLNNPSMQNLNAFDQKVFNHKPQQ